MTVTVDLVNSRALDLLKDLESFNIIRLISPVTEKDVDRDAEPCPLCAMYHEPNEKTIAAMEEGDAIVRGDIPSPVFNSFEEFLQDLKS
ncbi:MAG: hypothetical protein LBK77_02960 [Spirochaetaceae bacterium]|jgi:hypothetical protein|nr:hypothetical protein [Spirochaetaceae bacterium]